MKADAVLKLPHGARSSRWIVSKGELILSLAYHEAGHAVAGVALGFSLQSVEIYRPRVFLHGRAFFARPPLADRDPLYAVVGAAGPAAERRWLKSEGLTMDGVYADGDSRDTSDWRRVRRAARASGYPVDDFWKIAKWVMSNARVWRTVSALAAELVDRLERGRESASVSGPEALAIMGAHGVRPAGLPARPKRTPPARPGGLAAAELIQFVACANSRGAPRGSTL
jgi:hypothetical protein